MKRIRVLILAVAVLGGGTLSAGTAGAGSLGERKLAPPSQQPPPGANNWDCKPSAKHPNPVVLVHGLSANMANNWWSMSPVLANRGYCVFALTYGVDPRAPFPLDEMGGVVRMEESAKELAAFVNKVLKKTGARKVDIVGHSEGSLMPNYWVKFMGGAKKVDRYVGLTPLWDGTEFYGVGTMREMGEESGMSATVAGLFAEICGSCPQFIRGSEFIEKMNEGGTPAVPGVTYTMIMTRYDLLVLPYTSGVLEGHTNIVVQDVCPEDFADHAAVAYDPVVHRLVLNALDPTRAQPPYCPSKNSGV
jgi:triacylglycerol lipase